MKKVLAIHILGLFSGLALLGTLTNSANALPIHNPGFETLETIEGNSDSFGIWWGDKSEIVGTQNGITPNEGDQMLHFIYSKRNGPGSSVGSDVRQLIDVSQYDALINSGQAVVTASAWFNRVVGDSETDTLFQVRVEAFSGDPAGSHNELAQQDGEIIADNNLNSWEQAALSLVLPVGTDYLRLRISSRENIFNDESGTEFDGHYADKVYVGFGSGSNPVPEPGTLLLLGSSLAALGLYRHRRKAT